MSTWPVLFDRLAELDSLAEDGRRKRKLSYANAVRSAATGAITAPPAPSSASTWKALNEPASLTLWRETKRQREMAEAVKELVAVAPPPPPVVAEIAAPPLAPPPPPPPPAPALSPFRTRQNHLAQLPVAQFEKSHHKHFSRPKLFITQLTNTRTDILDKVRAPKQLFDIVLERAGRDKLELAMQAIANRIVLVAGSSLSIEKITRGEHHFALCYMTLMLCRQDGETNMFRDCVVRALERACPYVTPGAVGDILSSSSSSPEDKRTALGYDSKEEKDAEYLLRMQSLVGFYACLLQTTSTLMGRENKLWEGEEEAAAAGWENPFGGLAQAWRWIAGTLNAPVLRWTRFLLQAFLAVGGHELSRVCPAQQLRKVLVLVQSKSFLTSGSAQHEVEDADRNTSFLTFCREALALLNKNKQGGMLRSPGRLEDGAWIDARVLPSRAITNVG